jgi:type IV pilus assembly protein PilB
MAHPTAPTHTSAAHAWQQLLGVAMAQRASDIHLEPHDNGLTARLRIDGVLVCATTLGCAPIDAKLKDSVRSYIKISASMDIAQQRLPQDGHWLTSPNGADTQDCRIASIPTASGEKLVIRLLANNSACAPLSALGYDATELRMLQRSLRAPHGLILMTGPTGCGKTTSIYSALQTLDLAHINVCTIEDPVELLLPGVNQVQVNEAAGLTFTSALRALLRQDPDVIVVGEIRDSVSAQMAVQAAQTGHLVISTLHANSAAQAMARLLHMNIAPLDVSANVQLITAQRLLRLLCPACKTPQPPSALQVQAFAQCGIEVPAAIYGAPKASACAPTCTHCVNGYRGRIGIFEMLTPAASAAPTNPAHINDPSDLGNSSCRRDLRHSALLRISQGDTSWEEATRHVVLDAAAPPDGDTSSHSWPDASPSDHAAPNAHPPTRQA